MKPPIERRRFHMSGRVQGVGFRATTRGVASGFAVTGLVRNEADGTVTIEAQGETQEIEAFMARVREVMARHITSVSSMRIGVIPEDQGFAIERS